MKNNSPLPGNRHYEVSITKEELATLNPEKFEGEIVVVDTEEGAVEAAAELKKADMIGFDTETRPAFQKGQINHVALLQLVTPTRAFLIRLSRIGLPEIIKNILEDENLLKVGLSIKDDFHNLNKLTRLEPKGFIDLQEYVRNFQIADASLTKIHSIVFGKRISKSQQLTNWELPILTNRQKEYAALDALACINIYRHLSSGKFDPKASPYYRLKEKGEE